ncbi:Ultraviolet-B receptor UVR8 [Gracilariopsis chorda]|uniref:Ultraviolet-B receptor UVR8 n=1 Tax=Gracilariopsis chorda TaxID=448386 RepID=A0A2V3J6X9_9FLOR|nr:Ultraviolet-B receptor UVR8 [Gracilariopsis chorda]|eukprot:PXF49757.1 Ultraviolet-B receptor UVR8 [Gracilariopsis chorda]
MLRVLSLSPSSSYRFASRRLLCAHAWGNADLGQLGLPSAQLVEEAETIGRTAPRPQSIPALQQARLRTASASSAHSAFVTDGGELLTCGYGADGQLGHSNFEDKHTPRIVINLPQVQAVACGNRHTLTLSLDGRVFSFGSNRFGQLGLSHLSSITRRVNSPEEVKLLSSIDCPITSISAGDDFSVAVDEQGKVYTWGSSANGRLGHPDAVVQPSVIAFLLARSREAQHSPRLIPGLKHVKVNHVDCGKHLATAVCNGGRTYTWGSGRHFQISTTRADDEYEPVQPTHGLSIRKVAHGASHTLMLTDGGTVFALGENERGCLGIGNTASSRVVVEPIRIPGLAGVTDVAAGWRLSAAVVGSGPDARVFMWGCGEAGALGTGEAVDHWEPFDIGLRARKIFIGCDGTSVFALS